MTELYDLAQLLEYLAPIIAAYDEMAASGVSEVANELRTRPPSSVEAAARALVDAMDTCHICKGELAIDDGPSHCEDCSGDCDDHEEPECPTIYNLHLALKRTLNSLAAALDNPEQPEKTAIEKIYSIATQELSEPGDKTGVLVSICTLIEDGFVPQAEQAREWRAVHKRDGYEIKCQGAETPQDWVTRFPWMYRLEWRTPAGPWQDAEAPDA